MPYSCHFSKMWLTGGEIVKKPLKQRNDTIYLNLTCRITLAARFGFPLAQQSLLHWETA